MLDDYAMIRGRRTKQFYNELLPMPHRATTLVQGCCYALFEESIQDGSQADILAAEVNVRTPVAATSGGLCSQHESPQFADGRFAEEFPLGSHLKDHSPPRYVQFIFLERHFEMDLPQPTLHTEEANILLQRRRGFFFLGDRFPLHDSRNVIGSFHPLRKAFVYGDELEAAEDVAYIFFDLWRFPVDSHLFYSAFGGTFSWASGKLLGAG